MDMRPCGPRGTLVREESLRSRKTPSYGRRYERLFSRRTPNRTLTSQHGSTLRQGQLWRQGDLNNLRLLRREQVHRWLDVCGGGFAKTTPSVFASSRGAKIQHDECGAPFLGVPPQLMSAPHHTPRHVRELRSSQPVPLAAH